MSEFKREHRYWVFKRKHLSVREDDQMQSLAIQLGQEKCPDCVVVEEDWPECEIVWDLIKARAENRPSRIAELEEERDRLRKALHTIAYRAGNWTPDMTTAKKALQGEKR